MINAIIKGIFFLITKMFNLLFSPFISVITALFPALSPLFNYLTYFIKLSLTYVRSILSLILINDTMIITLFDYFIILYTIYLTTLAIKFAITIYNKFKL